MSSMLKAHRVGMFGPSSTTRSLPTSPSLGGTTPQPQQNDAKSIKQRALKTSLIHLLAVRAVSEKYIVGALGCTPADIKPLLEKYGRESPFDKTKFNLSDKGYKELDVWNFPYKDESDRQGAIDRAVTAFDRQRISIADQLWQLLLKKEERGKGISLSKLKNLHDGPVDRVRTPRIQVEATTEDGANSADKQSEEGRGRLAPGDAHQIRSRSQDPPSKKKVSEREAQSKRLFAKDPKKAAEKAAEMAKTRAMAAAKADKSTEEKKTTPKKAGAKSSANTSSKVKSAEFVHDSDEEIQSDEVATQSSQPPKRKAEEDISPPSKKVQPVPKPASKPASKAAPKSTAKTTPKQAPKQVAKAPTSKPTEQKPKPKAVPQQPAISKVEKAKKPLPASEPKDSRQNCSSSVPNSTNKRIPESARPVPMARTLSHKRSGSSPVKPSPLGSSPPTNASDLETEVVHKAVSSKSSSSSGSPLINQRRERLEAQAKKDAVRPAATSAGTVQKIGASPAGGSDRVLKRQANNLDADIHSHGKPKPAAYNNYNSSQEHLPKRPRLSSSPLSDPSSSDRDSLPRYDQSSSSNTSPSTLSAKDLEYVRSFKLQLAKYDAQLKEVQALHAKHQTVSEDKIDKLHRIHTKLLAHKQAIWKMGSER